MSASDPGPVPLRIGDAERDQAILHLQDHFAAGRLTGSEFDERLSLAIRARTAHDLAVLFTDLPWPHPPLGPVGPPLSRLGPPAGPPEWVPVPPPVVSPTHAVTACVLAVMTFGYLLPWAIAAVRNRSDAAQLGLVNILLGWTGVGWIVPLVMACQNEQPATPAWAPIAPDGTQRPPLPQPPGGGRR